MNNVGNVDGLSSEGQVLKKEQLNDTPRTTKPTDINPIRNNESVSIEELENAVREINVFFKLVERSLRFEIDKTSENIVIQVINETGEIIRQLPSKEMLELSQRLEDVRGLLFEERA